MERSQWLAPGALAELAWERLRRHLSWAYREVPYYTRLLDAHGLTPARVTSPADFARIPCLTKADLQTHFAALSSRTPLPGVLRVATGGSTGAPVTVLVDRERTAFTDAARLRAHRWWRADVGVPEVVLWGSPHELGKQDLVRTVRDRLLNSTLLSAFDLGEPALARYAAEIRRRRPLKLFGYASALYRLAQYLERAGWQAEAGWPRVIFTTAEPLYDFQRALIQRVFGCPVANEYGCREGGLVANECPDGGLHVPAEGILVEVDAPAGSRRGEIVLTNFESWAMPIIRYRTGDIGELDDTPCRCGRGLPRLGRVDGRSTDMLVSASGKVMHALAVIYPLRETPGIREFQVVQKTLHDVRLRIVPDARYAEDAMAKTVTAVRRLFDDTADVTVELVTAIERPLSGKHRYVVSELAGQAAGAEVPAR
jgi:phenylacetate-CoA ligase